ncbi:hypothetical protein QTG56_25870 (plasmid) [Rossellomorea sp. AcN35-11]|nr:hypothetical protein [Rossellomorea aquimaris]WJV32045.1 hypothetical protein QTG56_25870 [Rossellomorea sp. AcN35-11]
MTIEKLVCIDCNRSEDEVVLLQSPYTVYYKGVQSEMDISKEEAYCCLGCVLDREIERDEISKEYCEGAELSSAGKPAAVIRQNTSKYIQ